jgi:hypothetical protein
VFLKGKVKKENKNRYKERFFELKLEMKSTLHFPVEVYNNL